MSKLNVTVRWSGVLAGLVFAACGSTLVGSRYVTSTDAKAGQAALLTVDASQSAELAGTRLDVPAGALGADTRITLELGLGSILGAELAAGPAALFGPAETSFTSDVTLTLPVSGLGAGDEVGIVAEDAQGTTYEIDSTQVALNATRTQATFRIRRLGSFQPRRRVACMADSDCATGLVCRNGRCRTPSTMSGGDGGSGTVGCAMTCPSGTVCDPQRQACVQSTVACMSNADCPSNLACVNGACAPRTGPTVCASDMDCASGQQCTNGQCSASMTDGGTTNPVACMSNADCPSAAPACFNGVCRATCGGALASTEVCNGRDDDCDGLVDEGCSMADAGVVCGGFAGLQCPSGLSCVYSSNCNPMNGADCTGVCQLVDGGSNAGDGGMVVDAGPGPSVDGGVMTPGNDGGVSSVDGGVRDGGMNSSADGGR